MRSRPKRVIEDGSDYAEAIPRKLSRKFLSQYSTRLAAFLDRDIHDFHVAIAIDFHRHR
jgi:hypothetical protein